MINISVYDLKQIKVRGTRLDMSSRKVRSPLDVQHILNEVLDLENRAEEVFVLLTLDTKNHVTGLYEVSKGNISSSIVSPREVFQRALLNNASRIMVAHNHPSGDPTPSREDISVTKRLIECGELMGIPLLDHIIIGDECFESLKNLGEI